MIRIVVFVVSLLICTIHNVYASNTHFNLNETSTPLAVRVEKAQGLLRTWGFAAPDFVGQFSLSDGSGITEVQRALDTLTARQESLSTDEEASSEASHFLTWILARARMLNSLDFSEQALRHFYKVNPRQYRCEPTAKVSELLVPATYVDSLGTTAVLSEIGERLTREQFGRVAYETSLKFGKPDTGLKGDVTLAAAGAERFELYRQAQGAGGVGGPYQVADGYLFVQVHQMAADEKDCFLFYKNQVVQDYGREWLKKVYNDTLTTAARDLKPFINEVTSVPQSTDIAYGVGGHTVTFGEARATLPFLFGDEKTVAFWKSIQRQALEVELIFHSELGAAIRASDEYRKHLKILVLLREAQRKVKAVVAEEMTTASVLAWFDENRGRFTETGKVSYTLYRCSGSVSQSADADPGTTESAAQCAGELEKLRDGAVAASQSLPGSVVEEKLTSQTWASRSRETQVALQSLEPGEWSEVFSTDGKPQVLRLQAIDRRTPEPAEIWDKVREHYEIEKRRAYWQALAGLK